MVRQAEGSVMASIASLFELERERIEAERAAEERERSNEAARRAADLAARREREREQYREEAIRAREAEARVQAAREGELARIRSKTVRQAALDEAAIAAERDELAAKTIASPDARRMKAALIAVLALFVLGSSTAVFVWTGVIAPATLAREADALSAIQRERDARHRAEENEAVAVRERAEIEASLRALTNSPAPASPSAPPRVGPALRPRPQKPPLSTTPCRDNHDPLNPCLR